MSTHHYLGFLDPELEKYRNQLQPLLEKYAKASRIPWRLLSREESDFSKSISPNTASHPQQTFVAIGSNAYLAQLISTTCRTMQSSDSLPVFAQIPGPQLKNGPSQIINWLFERQSRTAFIALAGRKIIDEPLFSVNHAVWFRSRIVLIPEKPQDSDQKCHFTLTTLQGKLSVQAPAEKIIFQAMQSPEYPQPYLTLSVSKQARTTSPSKAEKLIALAPRQIFTHTNEDVFHSPLIIAHITSTISWHSELQSGVILPTKLTIKQAPFVLQRIVLKNDITQY
ncbi:hypothetical protein KBC99_01465 [Candidatus Saccharibacteria bacterium]|nr:hypothetical protein [Candidatus Saccharibacteria bacterium]